MRIVVLGAFMLAACTLAESAQAEDCGPLKRITTINALNSTGEIMLPVMINGTPRRFLFDSGGALSQISSAVVDELKLPRFDSRAKIFDVNGNISQKMTVVDSFAIGPLTAQHLDLQIETVAMTQIDGIVAPSMFPRSDIDIDFGPRRFSVFMTDHCPGRVTYWNPDVLAVVPVTTRDLHINIPVTVDGHPFQAIIDTGASGTFMSMDVAERVFGLKPDAPDMTVEGYANGDHKLSIYGHTFSNLSFEGVTVVDAHVQLISDRVSSKDADNRFETGSHIRRIDDNIRLPQVTLGMNVLSHLHVYFATAEHKLYISPAGAPDSPSPFGDPPK